MPTRHLYLGANALLYLRASNPGRRRNAIPRRPSYLGRSALLQLRASDCFSRRPAGGACFDSSALSDIRASVRDDPEGRPGGAPAPRCLHSIRWECCS